MKNADFQRWPDGTLVRFSDVARDAMKPCPGFSKPLPTPAAGANRVYTIDNTDDGCRGVILRETGERYGVFWQVYAGPRIVYTVWVDGRPTPADDFESAAEQWDRLTLGVSVPGGISIQEYDEKGICRRDGWLLHVQEDRSVYIHPRALAAI